MGVNNEVKMLIIGNGFDLAHNLPTKYIDFLNFLDGMDKQIRDDDKEIIKERIDKNIPLADVCKNANTYISAHGGIDGLLFMSHVFSAMKIICANDYYVNKKRCVELRNDKRAKYWNAVFAQLLCGNNLWLEYFQEKIIEQDSSLGERWVDFEAEIEKVVRKIEEQIYSSYALKQHEIKKIKEIVNNPNVYRGCLYEGRDVLFKLENDLGIIKASLELYLLFIEECIRVDNLDFVRNISDVDFLLSFNYTHIFEKYYKRDIEVEMIHGEVGEKNLILGVNETLYGEDVDEKLVCMKFKKYYQRIHNKTGLKYQGWLDGIAKEGRKLSLVIFGHSLDYSDADVLRNIVCHKAVKSIDIYYHDENAHNRLIANMVKLIGKDKLIERVGNKEIEFIKQ